MITVCGDGAANPLGWIVANVRDLTLKRGGAFNVDIDIICFCASSEKAERVRTALLAMEAVTAEGEA